jgi:hypothetical protein
MANLNFVLPDDVHRDAKIFCAKHDVTLKDFIIVAIREKIKRG